MRLRRVSMVLGLMVAVVCIVSPIYAADVLHRLTHGDQYSLVLGTVVAMSESVADVAVETVISGESLPDVISVAVPGEFMAMAAPAMRLAPGDDAVFSLNQDAATYRIAWGVFKVSSLELSTLEVIEGPLPQGDLAALQWYLNSGGIENDFYFIGTTAYVRRPDGTSLQIYAESPQASPPAAAPAALEGDRPVAEPATVVEPLREGTPSPALSLGLRRDFGYGMGIELQGALSLHVSGRDDLARVEFYMDDALLGELTVAPFRWPFHTDNFPPGLHQLRAVGYPADGRELHSNVITAKFLSKAEADQKTTQIIVPLVGGIFGLMALGFLLTFLASRRGGPLPAPGAPRTYGLVGGAICRRCGRPFARHLWAPNFITGKLERCPYCGKWSIAGRASAAALAAAEAAELAEGGEHSAPPLSEEERLRRELENSRYQEG